MNHFHPTGQRATFPLTFRFVLGFVCRLQYRLVEVLSKLLSTEALPGTGPAVVAQAVEPLRLLLELCE